MRLILGLMWLLHWLPLPVLGRLGDGVGAILFQVMGPRRHITLTNLRLCLPHPVRATAPADRDPAFPGLCQERAGTRHTMVGL